MSYSRISQCRICGNTNLVDTMDLGSQVLAGVFPESEAEKISEMPLILTKCHGDESCCHLVQLAHTFDLDALYGDNYGYRSGLNSHMVRHLQRKVAYIQNIIDIKKEDLVLDIGSNDGTTLSFYPQHIKDLVGIDPTASKFMSFYPENVKPISGFFSKSLYVSQYGDKKAKVITSLSMFYDLPDPVSFARDISDILHDQGIWILEQSYMPAMLDKLSYDTICHEHLEYYGLRQIKWIMDQVNLDIIDLSFNEINGGSFSVTVAHSRFSGKKSYSKVSEVLAQESVYATLTPFKRFAEQVQTSRDCLVEKLKRLKCEGKRVAALGASTKGNIILQYCQLDRTLISVIGEVNEDKFGKYTPGTHIPIESEDSVLKGAPDYLLVLPWHLRTFFDLSSKFRENNLIYPIENT